MAILGNSLKRQYERYKRDLMFPVNAAREGIVPAFVDAYSKNVSSGLDQARDIYNLGKRVFFGPNRPQVNEPITSPASPIEPSMVDTRRVTAQDVEQMFPEGDMTQLPRRSTESPVDVNQQVQQQPSVRLTPAPMLPPDTTTMVEPEQSQARTYQEALARARGLSTRPSQAAIDAARGMGISSIYDTTPADQREKERLAGEARVRGNVGSVARRQSVTEEYKQKLAQIAAGEQLRTAENVAAKQAEVEAARADAPVRAAQVKAEADAVEAQKNRDQELEIVRLGNQRAEDDYIRAKTDRYGADSAAATVASMELDKAMLAGDEERYKSGVKTFGDSLSTLLSTSKISKEGQSLAAKHMQALAGMPPDGTRVGLYRQLQSAIDIGDDKELRKVIMQQNDLLLSMGRNA